MKLKSVRIFGFKTFAERVEFDLNADIIAIVGPNGCGKSNIVDAILWGLGEPNARNLRAASGTDVIFNGSAKRKPLGFAEVSLLFDNEDGSLPLETAEVSITRRVNRAGESHFSINRRTCRLKDIYDLLADSGLGRAGYAIVGQSEIDQALSASAEERRAWIDEAAGVQRFRSKRVESLRRLEAARDHLARIDQILRDIEFQREPLRDEAEVAKRYQDIRSALSELETNLLVNEIKSAQGDYDRIEEQREVSNSQILTLRGELESLNRTIEGHGAELAELERKLDAQRELRQSHLTGVERAESGLALGKQRLASLDELEGDLNGAQGENDSLLRDAESEVSALLSEKEALVAQLTALRQEDTEEASTLRQELTQIDAQFEAARAYESTRLRYEAECAQGAKRLDAIQLEAAGIATARRELHEAILPIEAKVREWTDQLEKREAARMLVQTEVEGLLEWQASHQQAALQKAGEASILEARRRGLEATLETLDGLGQGARAVMELVRSKELPDSYLPVSSAIEVDERVAMAIETALGGAAHDLITHHDGEAKVAIELLKRKALGRATFQPLNLVRPMPSQARTLKGTGVVGVAADLVRCSPEHRPVIEAILGRIVIVETLDESIRLARTKGWSRLVTLEGEVVHSSGAVSGGRSARQGSGIVQRRAELAALENKLEEVKLDSSRLAQATCEKQATLEAAQIRLVAAVRAHGEATSERLEAANWLQQLQRELASTDREGERLDRERTALETSVPAPRSAKVSDLAELGKQRDVLLAKLATVNSDAEAAAARKNELQLLCMQAEHRCVAAQVRLVKARSGKATRAERLSGLSAERAEWTLKIHQTEQDKAAALAQAQQLKDDLESTQTKRKEQLEQGFRIAEEAKDMEQSLSRLSGIASKLEIERARCDSRHAAAAQRLLEDYAISEVAALRWEVQEVPEDAQSVVSRLRRDLKALGDVNIGAIEAYERLSSRYIELDTQREDVHAGMEELHGVVKELDRLTRDRFLSTFEQVKTAFAQAFVELFGGGEAELTLTDAEEVISAGVQVNVTIPGKKRQRLELLSGGERSMSAVAFLFALLRVKPSPLVVLDEIDAPLDGRNVERFVETLKSFAGMAQFLIITHNPVTIEAAPLWFGVTMQEPGCTAILPYSVPNEVVHESLLM